MIREHGRQRAKVRQVLRHLRQFDQHRVRLKLGDGAVEHAMELSRQMLGSDKGHTANAPPPEHPDLVAAHGKPAWPLR